MWIDPWGWACAPHGNSRQSTKPNHVYVIRNIVTGEVHKFGISGGKIRLDGKSYRAEAQVRALNRQAGGNVYQSRIIRQDLSRDRALRVEQGKVNAYSVAAQRRGTTGVGDSGVARPANAPIGPEGNIKPPPTM